MEARKLVVAITGGTGFIGRHLVDFHVRRGDSVRVLSRHALPPELSAKGVIGHKGDLSGEFPSAFARQVDVLYHCAAELRDFSRCWSVNVDGTSRLLRQATDVGRWVQLSSVGVYGPKLAGVITEDSPTLPDNLYEHSKLEAEHRVIQQAGTSGLDYAILRPSNVYGPGMPSRSLRQLAMAIRSGFFFFLGPPGASANYIFANNVAEALFLCATHPRASGGVFNLSDWRAMEDFVTAIAVALQVPTPSLRLPVKPMRALASVAQRIPGSPLTLARINALCVRAVYPAKKIMTDLNYRHGVSMEEGILRTMAKLLPESGGVSR